MSTRTHTVLVYSDAAATRDALVMAIGRRPAADLGQVAFVEASTGAELLAAIDAGGVDVLVLDGEARPTGGFGLAKQVKDEIDDCPPTLVLMARPGDAWLASWALADAVLPLPIDAPAVRDAVAGLVRQREAALPVRRAAAV
jgi:DNA-binding response OmpR family regulator